jgi:toxin ParE1/3/4
VRLIWSDAALTDLREIDRWIGIRNPAAARRRLARVRIAAGRLTAYPFIGRPGRIEGTRELTVTGTPYFLSYVVSAEAVEISRVIHSARNRPAAPRRLDFGKEDG